MAIHGDLYKLDQVLNVDPNAPPYKIGDVQERLGQSPYLQAQHVSIHTPTAHTHPRERTHSRHVTTSSEVSTSRQVLAGGREWNYGLLGRNLGARISTRCQHCTLHPLAHPRNRPREAWNVTAAAQERATIETPYHPYHSYHLSTLSTLSKSHKPDRPGGPTRRNCDFTVVSHTKRGRSNPASRQCEHIAGENGQLAHNCTRMHLNSSPRLLLR